MNNNIIIPIILLALFMGLTGTAECGVVIKVRAINPLDKESPVTIHYPLPAGITAEDVIGKRVARGKDPAQPADFQISFDENANAYFVDDQMTLAPKEIVVLEVEARDVWTVPQKTIDDLKSQAEGLVKAQPQAEGGEAPAPDPVAVKLKEEIFRQLEQVVQAQKANSITQVGVQEHIDAYQKNREILRQVGMDVTMLRNMMTTAPEAPAPSAVAPEAPAPVVAEPGPEKKSVADKLKSLFRWK